MMSSIRADRFSGMSLLIASMEVLSVHTTDVSNNALIRVPFKVGWHGQIPICPLQSTKQKQKKYSTFCQTSVDQEVGGIFLPALHFPVVSQVDLHYHTPRNLRFPMRAINPVVSPPNNSTARDLPGSFQIRVQVLGYGRVYINTWIDGYTHHHRRRSGRDQQQQGKEHQEYVFNFSEHSYS
jgi:hypothetical protein